MDINKILDSDQIDKIENPKLKSFIIETKNRISNKENVNPVDFMESCLGLMTDKEKDEGVTNRFQEMNRNAKKAMDYINKIKL